MSCGCGGGGRQAKSGFDFASFSAELDGLKAGRYRQSQLISVDLSAVVFDKEVAVPGGCNAVVIVAQWLDTQSQVVFKSDIATAIFCKLNSQQSPALGLSLIPNAGDMTGFVGTIGSLFISVPVAKAGAKIYLLALQSCSVLTAGVVGGPSGGGYVAPVSSSGGGGAPPPSSGSGDSGSGSGGGSHPRIS